ncbi:response regulator [Desulfosediminicola flagellatus]|uniref:hybrid sensor histidine kinase/response regulator n=1 Tax=Desulfosediminicola flagellatus TaxID=2569541 RepID=UPI0010AB5395|nr:response regulator [Desulfosediminicola flagellatus]
MVQSSAEQSLISPHILVIDDESRIRDACRMVLSSMGFSVETASDGVEGLNMIEDQHYDILLLDLMMPKMSGFEVLSKVKDIDPDTVVIVITGYATLEHSIEAMKKGAFDFIPKPFTPDQLRAVVSKSLRYTHALQDIATSKSRMRVMVNRLKDGVLTTDTEKRIVLANPAMRHMIGYKGGSPVGLLVDEVISDESLLHSIETTLSMPPGKYTEITHEIVIPHAVTNEEKIYSVVCSPFRGRTDQNLGTITVLHDITAVKQMDQMKSDFVSMVSHEIRSPINSLLMQLKIVLDGLAGEVTDKQREILGRASDKMLNLNNLVTELLDLSRIESGLVAHEKESVDIAALLNEQATFHQPYASKKALQITLEIDGKLPAILANPRHLEEVLSNLITNAIKYSPEGGSIKLLAGVEDDYLQLRIIDSGFGISEEDIGKIFTRFYRVKDQNTRTIHGTGLGLAIVKSIIDSMHGTITVQSEIGKGTEFTIMLPVNGH